MRITLAQRSTTCTKCSEAIEPGTTRLDDVIRFKNGAGYKRVHYHPECFNKAIESFSESITEEQVKNLRAGGGGRPAILELTEDERTIRKRLLNRLRNYNHYWIHSGKLPLQKPTEQLTIEDLESYQNYVFRFTNIAAQLEEVGGMPPRFQQLDIRQLQELIERLQQRFFKAKSPGMESESESDGSITVDVD